ncbi:MULTISPECIES: GtrA family protein [Bacteria]|uniref:GtrA family protein n=1 Tax=Bacteria TaxID=2 RepID=UPI00069BBEB2|nr:GtrA family protein [Leucobacter sp. Ag1]
MARFRLLSGSLPRYLITGAGMSALDFGLFMLCSAAFGAPPALANTISTIITVVTSYQLNRRFVFRGGQGGFMRFLSFAGVTLFTGLIVQTGIVLLLTALLSTTLPALPEYLVHGAAKVVAMAVGALCNYFCYKIILTRK